MPKELARDTKARMQSKGFSPMRDCNAPLQTLKNYTHKVIIGTATLGQVRIEWHNAINGLIIPVNFQFSNSTPIGFRTADAQNIVCKELLDRKFEWLFLLEDDTIPPLDLFLRLDRYMTKADVPIVSGLYALKSDVPQPFIFRGRGNGVHTDFTVGDKVWADGVPTGCLLVHASVIRAMAEHNGTYFLRANGANVTVPRVFETPRKAFEDAGTGTYQKLVGTSDLYFCDQLREHGILEKAGWGKIARKRFPYLVDTGINCGHIERDSGRIFKIGPHGDQLL